MQAMNTTHLKAALARVDASKLARLSGVTARTIYRIRDGAHSPRLETVERLMPHIKAAAKAKKVKR